MFHVYKNGICISGIFGALYTDDPETAYHWMHNRMKNNQYFNYRLHPDWAKAFTLERHDKRYRVHMGAPIEQAIIDTDEVDEEAYPQPLPERRGDEDVVAHGLDGLNGLQKGKDSHGLDGLDGCEEDDFYDPLDHPDRERHIPCCDHPNDHFGE